MMRNSPRAHRPGRDRRPEPEPKVNGSGQAGASYIEVLVTFLLLALVMGALIPLLTGGQQGYHEVRQRQLMIQNARAALDKLLREMRAAESFRTLSSSTLRFTLFWGDGTGDAPTVEYSLNGATNDLEYRWSANWDYRKQITVTAADAVAVDYAAALTFDHAALVSAGKSLSNGDDVRIRYWNGSKMIELDRFLDPTSAWNLTTTKIWFRLQAAIGSNSTDANYYLYYGNLSDGSPPANGDNVFLDYEDGTTLDGWTRRDANSGTYAATASDGVSFNAPLDKAFRELSKGVANSNVEIFWGFRSVSTTADAHQVGVTARRTDSGTGYWLVPAAEKNTRLTIFRATGWAAGTDIAHVSSSITSNVDYYGRFYLVGSSLRGKIWQVGSAEPGWQVTVTNTAVASGNHHGIMDGFDKPEDHRHRTMIIRPRVANEPSLTLAAEVAGTRSDLLAALAGPFRSMTVSCFDSAGTSIACSSTTLVRAVQVSLVVMDPDGRIADITVTGRAYREIP